MVAVSTKKAIEMADRRRQVAQLYLRKVSQEKIAEQMNVNRATISRDLAWLRKEWARQAVGDLGERKGRELAELEEMERDCVMQYTGSKDARWPTLRLRIKERIARMLGFDAPVKQDVTSGGEPLTLRVVYDAIDGKAETAT